MNSWKHNQHISNKVLSYSVIYIIRVNTVPLKKASYLLKLPQRFYYSDVTWQFWHSTKQMAIKINLIKINISVLYLFVSLLLFRTHIFVCKALRFKITRKKKKNLVGTDKLGSEFKVSWQRKSCSRKCCDIGAFLRILALEQLSQFN